MRRLLLAPDPSTSEYKRQLIRRLTARGVPTEWDYDPNEGHTNLPGLNPTGDGTCSMTGSDRWQLPDALGLGLGPGTIVAGALCIGATLAVIADVILAKVCAPV